MIVAADAAERVLETLRRNPDGQQAAIIGRVTTEMPGRVILKSKVGGKRVVDMLVGDMLPRIC